MNGRYLIFYNELFLMFPVFCQHADLLDHGLVHPGRHNLVHCDPRFIRKNLMEETKAADLVLHAKIWAGEGYLLGEDGITSHGKRERPKRFIPNLVFAISPTMT